MRLLFVCDPTPDFLQDAVFQGLASLLGSDAVLDYPPLPRYRGETPPQDARFPFLWLGLPPRQDATLDELLAAADGVVIGSLRDGALPHVRRVLESRRDLPTAFLDGEDHPYVRGIVDSVDVYFKRETLVRAPWLRARMPARRLHHRRTGARDWPDPLRREVAVATAADPRVVPLPLGLVHTDEPPAGPSRWDVAFLANATSPERVAVLAGLASLEAEGVRVLTLAHSGELGWREYLGELAAARLAISVRGLGYDTYRYWEIPFARAVLLAETPRTVIPRNFDDGREAFFAAPEGLVARARDLLGRSDLDEVAARGRDKLLAEHTSVRRAEVVLERLAAVRRRSG